MPQQTAASVENNFTKGLITEATGLSFPENAAFDTQNCVYEIIGDVVRREGFDYETNFLQDTVNKTNLAMSTYKWNNAGGDGQSQLIVRQIGATLYFFLSSSATTTLPLSRQKLSSVVNIASFQATGNANTVASTECTYADGNGYLIVYHKDCDPFYCTFTPGSLTTAAVVANRITIQIRDFFGIYPEPGNPSVTSRPTSLISSHNYNLRNQGWTAGQLWSGSQTVGNGSALITTFAGVTTTTSSLVSNAGSFTFTIQTGLPVQIGQLVTLNYNGTFNFIDGGGPVQGPLNWSISGAAGNVTAYASATGVITVNITSAGPTFTPSGGSPNSMTPLQETVSVSVAGNVSTISTWQTALGNYPSNADVWWRYKIPTTGVFSPAGVSVQLPNAQCPNGAFTFAAFNQNRAQVSGVVGVTSITTTVRPTNGCWFQGRAWYTGVNASQAATGELGFYTWTENIYFSQIIQNTSQFGYCFEQNDPTNEDFFDLLPDDGGVITIPGTGQIYKLFPVQNGLLVFAANGVWFITGSQGIGFAPNDYTVTKISGIQAISSTSFVNVMGWPLFWNEEGIYLASPNQSGQIKIDNICVGTILTYFSNIPLQSKKFARGSYNPIDYVIQWTFRSTNETDVTSRYQFDSVLNFNTVNKAFYPFTFANTTVTINDVEYVAGPGGSTSPSPTFKYLVSASNGAGSYVFTWAEEKDSTHFVDWFSKDSVGINYTSYFITGYKIRGQAQRRWQPGYVYMFFRNSSNNSYKIQGQWDFAIAGASGRWSTQQVVNDLQSTTNFGVIYHRHKIRGRGLSLQIKVSSVDGKPFDVVGWSIFETINAGI